MSGQDVPDRPALARLERFALTTDGGDLELTVVPPSGDHAPGSVRVLYVLDGDMYVGMVAELADLLATLSGRAPVVVVGIGYGRGPLTSAQLRTRDLTPPPAESQRGHLEQLSGLMGAEYGGADAFLETILEQVRPVVLDRRPEASAEGGILLGHSLAGFFVVRTLVARPDAFAAYLALSPSLWWDGFVTLQEARSRLAGKVARLAVPPRVFLGVGGTEQDVPNEVPPLLTGLTVEALRAQVASSQMVSAPRELAELLREAGIERCDFVDFAGATHTSVVPTGVYRGLELALSDLA